MKIIKIVCLSFLLISPFCINANPYKSVDSLVNLGLYQSALKKNKEVLKQSMQNNVSSLVLQGIMNQGRIWKEYEEEPLLLFLDFANNYLGQLASPAKEILYSLMAETYSDYYNNNRYRLQNKKSSFPLFPTFTLLLSKDLPMASASQILACIDSCYLRSLHPIVLLKNTPIGLYSSLMTHAEDTLFRPSLLDFLGHRYWDNPQEINQDEKINFVYQILKAANNQDTNVLVDLELKKIRHNSHESTNYISQLLSLYQRYPTSLLSSDLFYMIAMRYYDQSLQYQKRDTSYILYRDSSFFYAKKSLLFEENIKSQALLTELRKINLDCYIPSVLLPHQIYPAIIESVNVDSLVVKIYKLTQMQEQEGWSRKFISIEPWRASVMQQTPHIEFNLGEVDTLNIPSLEVGAYLFELNAFGASCDTETIFHQFSVSQLSAVFGSKNGFFQAYSLDRSSGKPLAGVKFQFYDKKYNHKEQKNELILYKELQSDPAGFVQMKMEENKQPYLVKMQTKTDQVLMESVYLYGEHRNTSKLEKITYIYTDRGLYRPGQTVEIKAIMVKNENDKKQVCIYETLDLEIIDSRGKSLVKTKLTTNDMGSVRYSFPLDENTEKGEYSIRISNGHGTFTVEAYKLPQFEVIIETPKVSYSLGDSITVKASAKSFSGLAISSAQVKYSVYKTYVSMWMPRMRGIFPPRKQDVFITRGVLNSDLNGAFQVKFESEKENNLHEIIQYQVVFDVSDLNGETQTNSIRLPLSHQSVFMSVDIPESLQLGNKNCFPITKTNIYGEKINGLAEIYVTHQLSGDTVFQGKIGEKDNLVCILNGNQWKAGNHKVTLVYQDANQKSFTFETSFKVFDQSPKSVQEEAIWCIPLDDYVVAGESAKILIGTSLEDVYFFYEIQTSISSKKSSSSIQKWIKLSKGQTVLSIPTQSETQYNPHITCFFVKNNRFYWQEKNIAMKSSIPELQIQIDSILPILEPGEKQKWKVKILNLEPKVSSELMLGMYDASLDFIRPFQWTKPYSNYSNLRSSWSGYSSQNDFHPLQLSPEYRNDTYYGESHMPYPALNWTGFGSNVMLYRSMAGGSAIAQHKMAVAENMSADAAIGELPASSENLPPLKFRQNFKETAFFFPQINYLQDSSYIEFTLPDALTKWKIQAFAHTPNFNFALNNWETQTQKSLMLTPQFPLFLYGGDSLNLNCKTQILVPDSTQKVSLIALFYDQNHNLLYKFSDSLYFNQEGIAISSWAFSIPDTISKLICEISAQTQGNVWMQDGIYKEISILSPYVLQKNTLNFQTLPQQTDTYSLLDLWNPKDESKEYYSFQVQGSTNPIWYAIYALPSLQPSNLDNSQTAISNLSYLYLGNQIIHAHPLIAQALKKEQKDTLPGLSIFFDEAENQKMQEKYTKNLEEFQMDNGGFVWFQGGRTHVSLSLQIAIQLTYMNQTQSKLFTNLMNYLDDEFLKEYNTYYAKDVNCKLNAISWKHIQYIYLKSLFTNIQDTTTKMFRYWDQQAQKYALKLGRKNQGLLALYFAQQGKSDLSRQILLAVKESSLYQKQTGRYWKKNSYTYDIESQALLIQAFSLFPEYSMMVEEMKNWLISQKRTQDWGASMATFSAIKSLNISQAVNRNQSATLYLGPDTIINVHNQGFSSGYFQKEWKVNQLDTNIKNLKIKNTGESVIYGGVYSTFIQNISKQAVTTKNKREKSLQIERSYETLKDGRMLVKLKISADQDFDFIHVQSNHMASYEMLQKLSGYQWKSGLFYYQSIDDNAVHFYIDKMPKGNFVLEYEVFVTHKGKFSDAGALIESLYAPEFSDRSN